MTTFPAAGYVSNAARTEAEMKAAFDDWLAATKQIPGASGAAISTLTIAAGTITPTTGLHAVETEGAAAADDLANIAQTNIPDGSLLLIFMVNGAHVVTVKHAAGGTGQISLANAADFVMAASEWLVLARSGTLWIEVTRFFGTQGAAERAYYGAAGFAQNAFTGRQLWAKGADIASAATITPGTDGNYFHITGTTGITAIATLQAGARVAFEFDNALTITHNATSLILAIGRAYTTRPGDVMEFVSEGSGNWRQCGASAVGSADVTLAARFREDFFSPLDDVGSGTALRLASGTWIGQTPGAFQQDARGVFRFASNGHVTGPYDGTSLANLQTVVKAADLPVLTLRIKVAANASGTKRAGATNAILTADPTEGIYVRWTTGNYFAVCRSGGVETTLDLTTTPNATWRTFRFVISPSLVTVYVDGVSKGTIASNIPTANLSLSAASNSTDNPDIDYFDVETPR